jgi:hypothetical protein
MKMKSECDMIDLVYVLLPEVFSLICGQDLLSIYHSSRDPLVSSARGGKVNTL